MSNSNKLTPWSDAQKKAWLEKQQIKRSYKDEVVSKVLKLNGHFEILQYGSLSIDPQRYSLYLIKSKNFDPSKRSILITGGVHGYETSGVQGALRFFEKEAAHYTDKFNFICAPCISPWAYETINRWNSEAIDPNRSFYNDGPCEESSLFLKALSSLNLELLAHFDLHETTDTDNTVFRPALQERDGIIQDIWEIPDGFYVVGDSENPKKEFQRAIIESVEKVTHIALSDENGKIIGVSLEQKGVINYPLKKLFLCAGFSGAEFTTTTEVYPDSPKVTDLNCIEAQVAAIVGGLDYLLSLPH